MPGGDRTGPRGLGSMTGRALGYCAGYDTPGYTKGPGMGLGRGFGGGRGMGYGRGIGWGRGGGRRFGGLWGYSAPFFGPNLVPPPVYPLPPTTPDAQLNMLKQEKQYLESEMESIKSAMDNISKRIDDLEKTE